MVPASEGAVRLAKEAWVYITERWTPRDDGGYDVEVRRTDTDKVVRRYVADMLPVKKFEAP
jgi:hypothetical protein